MGFSVGIVGLPNVGKSTLFESLTKKDVEIAPRPFTTIQPNFGIVAVPDERLLQVAKIIKPEKVTPTVIEFIDIAGLIRGAYKGEGLGNQFLAHIRNCDAILEVVRCFQDPNVENILGEINPEKEIGILQVELLMKDLETLENLISKLEKKGDKTSHQNLVEGKKIGILKKIKEEISKGKPISEINLTEEERLEIKEYQFLTQKPIFYILNTDGKSQCLTPGVKHLAMNLKEEEEISELSEEEKKELEVKSKLDQLIKTCYDILDLITFFTVAGGKEVRAWTLKRGKKAREAGGVVHSDFKEKFIKAEVIPWQSLVESGSWSKSRENGFLQIAGKDYVVQDGDVIEFRI